MRMGASGCVGAQGARGTQKTRQEGAFMVSKEGIWMLWPGKFPRTSCVGKIRKNMYESLKMGVHGRVWVGANMCFRKFSLIISISYSQVYLCLICVSKSINCVASVCSRYHYSFIDTLYFSIPFMLLPMGWPPPLPTGTPGNSYVSFGWRMNVL